MRRIGIHFHSAQPFKPRSARRETIQPQAQGRPEREVGGWKEIAEYLGVSVRTAQSLERAGLPVRRLSGPKGRVFAFAGELDAWKAGDATGIPSALAELSTETSDRRAESRAVSKVLSAHKGLLLFIAAAIILGLCVPTYFQLASHRVPADLIVQRRSLIVRDSQGRELWHHTFPIPLREDFYTQATSLDHTWFGDLDGDGKSEVLFVAAPIDERDVGRGVLCFGANGSLKWQFKPGRPVTDASGDYMLPPYFVSSMQVVIGKTADQNRVVLSSSHYLNQPNQVAVLDSHGRIAAEYWHPGHLTHMAQADLDGSGRRDVLLAGVNNGNHQATLVVLDPLSLSGVITPAVMKDDRFRLLNMSASHEKAVVFFSRSSISLGQPYTRAADVHVTDQHRIVVTVAEGTSENNPGFVYEFDFALRVVNVVPTGDQVRQLYDSLSAQGKVTQPFDVVEECNRLKASVIVVRQ